MLGCSAGLLAKSQISLVTCCSHWHSTCVTCNLGACLCPMCPHSSGLCHLGDKDSYIIVPPITLCQLCNFGWKTVKI